MSDEILPPDPDDHLADDPLATASRAGRGRPLVLLLGLVVVTAVVTFVVVSRPAGHSAGAAPLDLSTVSESIAGHYQYAKAHADDFRQITCWCGCQQYLGHHNLEDCFIRPDDGHGWESHAAGCGVCIGEAAIAAQMLDAGKTAAEIRAVVAAEFGTTAITVPRS